MVELQDAARRAKILAAAVDEFARHGLAGSRVQRIVDQAGVNKQLLFYYFGSKDGLFQVAMAESWVDLRRHSAAADHDTRATVRLRSAIRSVFSGLSQRPHLVRFLSQDADTRGPAGVLRGEILTDLQSGFSAIVANGQSLGYFREDADPDGVARHAVGLLLGHLCIAPPDDTRTDPGVADQCCDLLLRGLEW